MLPEDEMQVSELFVEDGFEEDVDPHVYVNGSRVEAERVGQGYSRRLKMQLNDVVDQNGLLVVVSSGPVGVSPLPKQRVEKGGDELYDLLGKSLEKANKVQKKIISQ